MRGEPQVAAAAPTSKTPVGGFLFFQPAARDGAGWDESYSRQGCLGSGGFGSAGAGWCVGLVCTHGPEGQTCPQLPPVPRVREEGMSRTALPVPGQASCDPSAGSWAAVTACGLGAEPRSLLTEDALSLRAQFGYWHLCA